MDRPRIVLADDHPAFLDCAAKLLGPEFEVVEAVGDGEALIEAAQRCDPDLLVIDISMPCLTGLEAARRLKAAGLRAKVIFLTVHQDQEFVGAALSLGANGYVTKSRLATDLVPALREALADRCFVSSF
jgi:DNA-binding NarL/FixJ family response regulator